MISNMIKHGNVALQNGLQYVFMRDHAFEKSNKAGPAVYSISDAFREPIRQSTFYPGNSLLCPLSKMAGHIALHVSSCTLGWLVCQSVSHILYNQLLEILNPIDFKHSTLTPIYLQVISMAWQVSGSRLFCILLNCITYILVNNHFYASLNHFEVYNDIEEHMT